MPDKIDLLIAIYAKKLRMADAHTFENVLAEFARDVIKRVEEIVCEEIDAETAGTFARKQQQ